MEEIIRENQTEEDLIGIEKQKKIEKERTILLNSAVNGDINNIKEKVAYILNNSSSARNSDIELAWIYWHTFESEIIDGNALTKDKLFRLTKINSLTRVRAKIQNEYKLFQADENVKKFRGVLEEEKRQEAIEDKPSYPIYSVYIDETGKNQDFISVGSLWLTDSALAFQTLFKFKEWLRIHNLNYEFHFSELKAHKLDEYKNFFNAFVNFYPIAGFKVIVVNKNGISNISDAITDLTFHLINNGIEHENVTGRAPLPRKLQVWLDNEEVGSDKLKLENIKERLKSQNIEGLHFDNFDVVDSKQNYYLQIVDLFVSSINRKLNNKSNNFNFKDELADYILKLIDFDLSELDCVENSIDKSKVFNLTYKK